MHQKLLSGKAALVELTALPQITQLDLLGKGTDRARGREEKGKQKGEGCGKRERGRRKMEGIGKVGGRDWLEGRLPPD